MLPRLQRSPKSFYIRSCLSWLTPVVRRRRRNRCDTEEADGLYTRGILFNMSNRITKAACATSVAMPKLEAYCTARGIEQSTLVEHLVMRHLEQDYDQTTEPYRLRRPEADLSRHTAIDLFSGGWRHHSWVEQCRLLQVLFATDINKGCEATHRRNFPEIPFERADIRELSGADAGRAAGVKKGQLDLLIGGPPCQGFSILGSRDDGDPRNDLFRHFLRIGAYLQPKAIVIENVSGLATLRKGAVIRDIGAAFAAIGYDVDCAELVAAQYGVPQLRWRMIFIGWRRDLGRRGGFPLPSHGGCKIGDLVPNRTLKPYETEGFVSIFDAIGDLPEIDSGGQRMDYTAEPSTPFQRAMRAEAGDALHNHYAPKLSKQNLERITI